MGVVEYTPLLDLEGFDVVWNLPLEEFHLIKEGLTKKMLQRMGFFTINIDAPRKRRAEKNTTREIMELFNKAYCTMAVFSETSRRPRPLKLHQFKGALCLRFATRSFLNRFLTGSEFGTLTLSCFPSLFADFIKHKSSKWYWLTTK